MRNVILARLGRRFEITGSPPVGNVGDAYSFTFGTSGGSGTITWSATSLGSSGATFSAGTVSSLALTNSGSFTFTVTAIDENRQVAVATFALVVLGSTVEYLQDESGADLLDESGPGLVAE